ncbi:checkpoint protein Hus1/Mec3, partial [Mucor mucedo]|uniref:checkpoint protein Hus1/Mec3 n=1 Tax=Mucor mucedo TaxID=29922 RepID=UPI0022209894
MDFKGVFVSTKDFSKLTGFLKKMGEICLITLKDHHIKMVAYTAGTTSTSVWVKVDPEAIFARYLLQGTISLLVQARDLHQMVYAVSQSKSTTVELIHHNIEQPFLRFTSESDHAEEIGELDVDLVSEHQVRHIKEPGTDIPDVCLTLPPINSLVNFVTAHSRTIETISLCANRTGYLQLSVKSPSVAAELVTNGLTIPPLSVRIPDLEDPTTEFTVHVKSKQIKKFLNCKMLNLTDVFFSIKDRVQLNFFVFFNLGNGANSVLTVHVPIFI